MNMPARAASPTRRSVPLTEALPVNEAPELPGFEGADAREILSWAFDEFSPDIVLASSMQDAVLIDLAWHIEPKVTVFFLETAFHFYETMETANRIRERYDLDLVMLEPVKDPRVWSDHGYTACCQDRKVIPMNNFLKGRSAWITGLRRGDSPARVNARAAEWDPVRKLVKVNPIVEWTSAQVDRYIADNGLIVNPLRREGYGSIGCVPCTAPGNGREGRWADSVRVECGIHVPLPLSVDSRRG